MVLGASVPRSRTRSCSGCSRFDVTVAASLLFADYPGAVAGTRHLRLDSLSEAFFSKPI